MMNVLEETGSHVANFERLEIETAAENPAWLRDLRRDAIRQFSQLGFPSTRQEEWRFTNIAPIARVPFRLPERNGFSLTPGDFSQHTFGETDCCRVVFVDGFYAPWLSDLRTQPKNVRIGSLAAALADGGDALRPHLAQHAPYESDAFAALNTAFIRDGAFVSVPDNVALADVIHLLFLSTASGEPFALQPRVLVLAGSASELTIVESHVALRSGTYLNNAVTEIVAGRDSVVHYHKLQRESESAFHVSTLQVRQERGSSFAAHSLSLGGGLVRNNVVGVLAGEGCECTLNGLYVTKGRQHVDNHTTIDHASPHCNSRELYKGILDEQSSGVFNGRVVVRKDAQKTNAKQTNKNLLLSESALVNTAPQLEIFADDVKCTHGATIGQLNADEMFYMRSRGIDAETARTLLTYAFASEVIGLVKIKPIQCQLDLVLMNRLSRAHGTRSV